MANVSKTISSESEIINSLLHEYKWSTDAESSLTISYSFPSGSDTSWTSSYNADENLSWNAVSSAEQTKIISALKKWSDVADINFVYSDDTSTQFGDLRFAHSDAVENDNSAAAWAYEIWPQFVSGTAAHSASGDIWLDNSNYAQEEDNYTYSTLLHEIGHALGLAHPHGGNTIMAAEFDKSQYTLMSYNQHPDSLINGNYETSPMLYDIAAIQHLYGKNTSFNSDDTSYQFNTTGDIQTVWDAGGEDVFDFSNQTYGVNVSLLAGEFSSVGYLYGAQQTATNNLAIAFDVTIEDVVGTDANDTITGNNDDNKMTGGVGNDYLNGLEGEDIALYNFDYSLASISFSSSTVTVVSSEGTDTLENIEAIEFADGIVHLATHELPQKVADDELVGRIVSLYEAALDRVPDLSGLNNWVDAYTQGKNIEDIAAGLVNSQEFNDNFSVTSHEAFIETLYQNVLGRSGDVEGLEFWTQALDNGHSYEGVLLSFSDSAENQNQIAPLLETLSYAVADDFWTFS